MNLNKAWGSLCFIWAISLYFSRLLWIFVPISTAFIFVNYYYASFYKVIVLPPAEIIFKRPLTHFWATPLKDNLIALTYLLFMWLYICCSSLLCILYGKLCAINDWMKMQVYYQSYLPWSRCKLLAPLRVCQAAESTLQDLCKNQLNMAVISIMYVKYLIKTWLMKMFQ